MPGVIPFQTFLLAPHDLAGAVGAVGATVVLELEPEAAAGGAGGGGGIKKPPITLNADGTGGGGSAGVPPGSGDAFELHIDTTASIKISSDTGSTYTLQFTDKRARDLHLQRLATIFQVKQSKIDDTMKLLGVDSEPKYMEYLAAKVALIGMALVNAAKEIELDFMALKKFFFSSVSI